MIRTKLQPPVLLVLASTYPRWQDDPEPGFVHELCKRLTDSFRVIVVVPDAPDADPSGMLDGVLVKRYRYAPRRLQTLVNNGGIAANLRSYPWKLLLVPSFVVCQYLAARKLSKHYSASVIHAHWLIPQGLVARCLAGRSIPYLVTSHGGDLFGLRGALLSNIKRKVAASSTAMTVVSTAMREEAARQKLQPPEISVIPMGVDMQERFTPMPETERMQDHLLFVGRLVAKKGLHHLLNAMPGILAARPAVTLTIAGFGPEEEALRQQVRRLDLTGQVNFIGAQPQRALPRLYCEASLVVAPFVRDDSGNQEGLPVVLMEAIACGCPVIAGDVAGIRELLGEAAATACVRPQDTRALTEAVVNVLNRPGVAQAQAQRIRRAILKQADWQAVAQAYTHRLEKCMQPSTATADGR